MGLNSAFPDCPAAIAAVLNCCRFLGHLKERLGTDVDRDNLYVLFSQLGYKICIQTCRLVY